MNATRTARSSAPTRRESDARSQRHSSWTIALHWSTVLALVVSVLAVLWRLAIEDEGLRTLLLNVHRQLGLFVLVALALRLLVRAIIGLADHAGEMHALLRWAARLAHVGLYALLLVLPLLGLAASHAHAVDVTLFGLIRLPSLVADDPDLADALTDYHLWAAWGLLFLVVAHAGAAVWHHRVRRDGVLVAMLPLLERSSSATDAAKRTKRRLPQHFADAMSSTSAAHPPHRTRRYTDRPDASNAAPM